jgi:hypothetical protein
MRHLREGPGLEVLTGGAMATEVDLQRLDDDIAAAWISLGVARRNWARCPTTENVQHERRAEARLNKLLEFRFTVQTSP